MEKRLNDKAKQYVVEFKNAIRARIMDLNFAEEPTKINDLLEYVYEYDRLCFEKDDFIKRKRVKNAIPLMNRCNAKRASGEQCTRKRRSDCEFCGTHYKGTPHGIVSGELNADDAGQMHKLEVVAADIGGIVYYLDAFGNVYNTEDVLQDKSNPQIIARYTKRDNQYCIPEFGLM